MPVIDNITAKRLAERMKKLYGKKILLKNEIFGKTPPSNLITVKSYPKVSLGILSSEEFVLQDNPLVYEENKYSIEDIIKYRTSLINSYKYVDVNIPKKGDLFYDKILEGILSIKPIDIEVKIKNIKESRFFSKILSFYGFSAKLEDIKIVENPKIPKIVDNILMNDLKAEEAVFTLYKENFSDYYISRLFSLGLFGIDKKLVPSKWSITAVQSIIYKKLIKNVKEFKMIDEYYVFNYKYYGNDFYSLLLPGNGNIELIEAILPGSAYNLKYDKPIIGKDDVSGGYHAAKLSFVEYLNFYKIKADAIIFRIVTNEYKFPLGVWVVREGVKRMFLYKERFKELREALDYLNKKINKYNLSIYKLLSKSNIIKNYKNSILRFI